MEYKELNEILQYEQPTKYLVDSVNYSNEFKTPVLTAGQTFILGFTDEENNIFPADKLPVIIFDDFTTASKYVDFPFKVKSSAMKILLPIKNTNLKYVFYAMQNLHFDASTHKRYWISAYSNLKIPMPTLEEQNKIVERLDKIQALIEENKKQIDLCNELKKCKFREMFGTNKKNEKHWNKLKLEEVTEKITDGKHGGCEKKENSGYYFIGATEIRNFKINYENATQITKEDFVKDYNRCDLKIGDLVIVNTGATIGKTAIADNHLTEKTLLQKSVAMIRTKKEKLIPTFLQYCYVCNEELYNQGQGCARVNLLLSQIKNTEIILPPTNLQKEFEDYVMKVNFLISNYENELNKLSELYNGLMNKYFN